MTPLTSAALVCVCLGGGVVSLHRALRRSPTSLAAVRARGGRATPRSTSNGIVESVTRSGVGRAVERRLGAGLLLVGWTTVDVVSRVLVGSALAAFAATAGIGSATVAGVLPPSPWWLVVVPLAALAAGWVMWSDASVRVERRRREVRQAANDLVQLLAVGLTTDQSVEQAVQFALSVGSTDSFDLIRRHLGSSARRGVPLWEALHSFGDDAGIRELGELAVSIERQGVQGVSIGETVATLAASMRAAALDELEREADRANANLSGPTIGFVVTTVVFLAYPLAMRVSEAFGG